MAGRKKKNLAKPIEAEIFFSDITLSETEGNYDLVKEIMNSSEEEFKKGVAWGNVPKLKSLGEHDWILRSKVTTSSQFGAGDFILNFYWNKKVYIVDYYGNYRDPFSNFDVKCLSRWCQENGLERPEPVEYLAVTNLDFWKHFWETSIVSSQYFDKRFSNRKNVENEEEDIKDLSEE